MKTLIVHESWFGNTRRIAEKVAAALAPESEVEIVSVADPVPPLDSVDLVVLGAPTHVRGLSLARSRRAAVDQAGNGADPGIGARDWIERLPLGGGPRVAVFDTRVHKPELLVGSAARGMARRLRLRGYRLAVDPESFFVAGTDGPLLDGELERAWEWGRALADEVLSPAA